MKSHGYSSRTIQEEIQGIESLLSYVDVDTSTGKVYWKIQRGPMSPGSEAGSKNEYSQIHFKGSMYLRHRIVFYVENGYLPPIVDHVYGVENGDTARNIQKATNQQNAMKKKCNSNSSTGLKGVSYHKANGKYKAQINIDGKRKFLGYYTTPEEAKAVYDRKAKEVFGTFFNETT